METAATTLPTPEPELGTLAQIRNTTLTTVWNWTAREALWSVDVFARMFATIVVLRTVSQLVATWWFPKGIWDASPALVRGFGEAPPSRSEGAEAETTEADGDDTDIPEFVMAFDGDRFFRHRTRYTEQFFACPLLYREPCRDCRWFVQDLDGQPRCAAVAKVALRHHERYRLFTLDELCTLLERGRPSSFA